MNKKRAFTLAELMVVILIITIIFSALAPVITKRRIQIDRDKHAVWNWLSTTTGRDAYYVPAAKSNTGIAFFNVEPTNKDEIFAKYLPLARIVVNADNGGSQFRFYSNTDSVNVGYDKNFTGSWIFTDKVLLLGDSWTRTGSGANRGQYNTGIGNFAVDGTTDGADRNTGIGYDALARNNSGKDNTAIGVTAGGWIKNTNNNTMIGVNTTGQNEDYGTIGSNNTFVGRNSGQYNNGTTNTFIGMNTGQANSTQSSNNSASYNVAVGYNALRNVSTGSYNTALGYGALKNVTSGNYNVGIGYNACSNITTGSKKTCIGANSGPVANEYDTKTYDMNDDVERTYIGSRPRNFGGSAVLEIHNPDTTNNYLVNAPEVRGDPTTIVNGNLIVKGNMYFTSGSYLRKMAYENFGGYNMLKAKTICASNQTTYSFASGCGLQETAPINSDRRLKNIGSPNNDGLDKIKQLKVFNFTFKGDKAPQVGVIAQDLEKVFPKSVVKNNKGFLEIRWDEMFYGIINSIKELNKQVIAYLKEVVTLEKKITKLEKENTQLQKKVNSLNARLNKLKN